MYHDGLSYKKISNILNDEKVLGKTNWRDSTILNLLENPIYKGDFLHGKRTKHPTYYENVVEPLVTKEYWEECQVQQKKNSRSYQRTLNYLFLQKLKCPKCGRILGGKATTKKNGISYYYYYCNDCKINIKEKTIENSVDEFMDSIVEYDSIVNQYFLPMIKQKIENPKDEIEKELKSQKDKFNRIREAYINEVFTLDEYNKERKKLENIIDNLETKLKDTEVCEQLKFTPNDILVKRDIDFINSIKYPDKYQNIQELSITLKDVDKELKDDKKQIKVLTENNNALELRNKNLNFKIKEKDNKIDELEKENLSLKSMIYSLKERFKKLIKFLTDKMFDRADRDLYYDVSKDLYTHGIIKDNDMDEIYDDYKYSKEKESKNKNDDFGL